MINGKPAKWTEKKVNEKGATVILQNVRLAFVSLAQPKMFDGQDPNYMVSCLVPDKEFSSMKAKIEKTVKTVLAENKELNEKQKKTALKNALSFGDPGSLFKDGNESTNAEGKVYDGFEDSWVLKAKTKAEQLSDDTFKAKVDLKLVDSRNNVIPREDLDHELYSGVWADVAITVKPYTPKGTVPAGVTCYLAGVMKLKDGDRLGVSSPFDTRDDMGGFDDDLDDDDFEEVEEEEEVPARSKGKKGKKKDF